ncbi:PP2C family serine/threonine-protein phosphatase [Aspergillus chevalieri]|uniref:PPM-type phosphatase domain-containing protein n=1 Tax=Aspergillus chevalieri TaxID=182096 RepID=A0A7R7ZLA4_ASPCH|nr:uncharacterized protein ACHE_20649S [Aspergillus chevalieri]BCR85191.1 hypothetical protein ACHE_20649S [Aspergillus chevalieri]
MFRNVLMANPDSLLLFDAGVGQAQGGRPHQEDRCTFILPDQFPARTEHRLALFAVYDGHGSELVAEHASWNLHSLLAKRPEFQKGDYEAAIKAALSDEDAILLERYRNETREPAVSGSTVALCFLNLTTGELVVANLGDSHAVLAERDPKYDTPFRIRRLTVSHKPDVPAERSRIEDAGGTVNRNTGTARVGSLNMSRAIGDLQYKNPINNMDDNESTSSSSSASSTPSVSSAFSKLRRASSASSAPENRGNFLSNEPYMTRVKLSSERRYILVIESDGISDHLDDNTLMQYVTKLSSRGYRAGKIAQEMAASTTSRKGSDNGSCIVIFLDGQNA